MQWEYMQVNESVLVPKDPATYSPPLRVYLEGAVPEGWPTTLSMSMVDALNHLGVHGWEVCAMFVRGEVREPDTSDTYAFVKRPRELPPPPA